MNVNLKLFFLCHFNPFCITTSGYVVFICITAELNAVDKNECTDAGTFP